MLHFAYGSNMHRAIMRRHAPQAELLGTAVLKNYRFVITADGYASVEPKRAATVHGVLWRITLRDRVTLDLWESVARGLYRAEFLPVRQSRGPKPALVQALVYVARQRPEGRPKAGYMELVIDAARQWQFPPGYIASLQHWLSDAPLAVGPRALPEFGGKEP
jgi:hypothetical protein